MFKRISLIIFSSVQIFVVAQNGGNIKNTQESIKLVAVGDIMIGTDYPNSSYLPKDGIYPFKDVDSILKTSDLLFGNLEGTLSNTGKNAKFCKDPSKCYSFRSPESYGKYLNQAGFDLMSIANNHISDFGRIGIDNTIKTLNANDIKSAGLEDIKPTTIFEKNGVVYGFVAFAPNNNCLKINNIKNAKKIVHELSEKVDIVIVSFHGGAEGTEHKNVTRKIEYFYGENRGNVYEFSHEMIDAGADVIFGHGPHVVRAIEVYKNKLIAYSLGNFATYKRFSLKGVKAFSPILEVNIDKTGNFISGKIHSAKQTKERYPYFDKNQGAFKEIKLLTQVDFPESKIKFNTDGSFYVKN